MRALALTLDRHPEIISRAFSDVVSRSLSDFVLAFDGGILAEAKRLIQEEAAGIQKGGTLARDAADANAMSRALSNEKRDDAHRSIQPNGTQKRVPRHLPKSRRK